MDLSISVSVLPSSASGILKRVPCSTLLLATSRGDFALLIAASRRGFALLRATSRGNFASLLATSRGNFASLLATFRVRSSADLSYRGG